MQWHVHCTRRSNLESQRLAPSIKEGRGGGDGGMVAYWGSNGRWRAQCTPGEGKGKKKKGEGKKNVETRRGLGDGIEVKPISEVTLFG